MTNQLTQRECELGEIKLAAAIIVKLPKQRIDCLDVHLWRTHGSETTSNALG